MIEYQIVLKYKSSIQEEEIVGRTYDKIQATKLKDLYNEQEDNSNIYYLVKSVQVQKPFVKKRRVN